MNKLPGFALTLMAPFFSLGVIAEDKPVDFTLKLGAGAEYDSTLTVVELDRSSNKGDWAAVFDGEVGAELQPTDRITLKGSYSFSSSNYREYTEFDQDLHLASLDGSVDFAGMTLGASHHFAHARLAAEPLLDLSKTSLYAGKLVDGNIYLRGAYSESSKRFENRGERDADANEFAADVYFFFDSARSYWSFGVSQETEAAQSPAFDNDALKLRARYSHTGEFAGRKSRLQLGWRYLSRDYSNEESMLGRNEEPPVENGEESPLDREDSLLGRNENPMVEENTRYDRSQVIEASWALGLVDWLTLETKVEYGNYSSNFEPADYRETTVSTLLKAEF